MSAGAHVHDHATHEPWRSACGAVAIASFLIIVAHVALPPAFGLELPYAGGGAVVLGLGATLGLGLGSRSARLAVAVALAGLVGLRTLSAFRPDLLIAEHGALSATDAVALTVLVLASAAMIVVASSRARTSGR